MESTTRSIIVGASFLSFVSGVLAQQCIDDVCFVDRGASGEISLGAISGAPCAIDYDNDGFPDLLVRTGVGALARLFHNIPDPAREGERTFEEVTASSVFAAYTGVAGTPAAALAADFDNDGFTDVYLMGRRTGEMVSGRLYRNDGAGGFIDVTAASGVQATGDNPESASWVDFDLDGWVDLCVASSTGSTHLVRLLRNLGNGSFADVPADALPTFAGWSRMYSHTWSDYDSDGYPDCFMMPSNGPLLLHNVPDGQGGRRFENSAASAGFTVLGPAPMGIAAGDYDNDGDFDIGLSNGAVGVYYENVAGQMTRRFLLTSIWAWGTLWIDVNNDGLLDHYQAGSVGVGSNHNKLFLNQGAGAFIDISPALNDLFVASQHALQLDFNNDGRQDIVTMNPFNDPTFVSINENISPAPNHWLTIRLRGDGVRVNSDAIGAVVRVHAGGAVQSHEVTSGSSTSSTDDPRQHFGLGSATAADMIEVTWPRQGTLTQRTEFFHGPFESGQFLTLQPLCPADFNADGTTDSRDFFDFLGEFFAGGARADLTGDATIDSRDFFEFLRLYFAGC